MKTEQTCVETPATLRELKDVLQKEAHRGEEEDPDKKDKSNYVHLELMDVDLCGTNPEKDSGFGQKKDQMPAFINGSNAGALRETEAAKQVAIKTNTETKTHNVSGVVKYVENVKEGPPDPSNLPCLNAKSEGCFKSGVEGERAMTQSEVSKRKDNKNPPQGEGLYSIDNYLSGRSDEDSEEEDDDISSVICDDCVSCVTEDESHYITTHEIQLLELSDHEQDFDLGGGSSTSWDIEDDNQVYSFVDYASCNGGGTAGERGDAVQPRSTVATTAVSTPLESDPIDGAKFTSSDESVSKHLQQHQRSGNSSGQIHLSIRTTSRAINDPGSIQERGGILYHARRSGDMSRYVLKGVDGKAETLCDRAKCFIAAPGRLHFGCRLTGKEVTGYSSGASSAVSSLDEADKEVRNLTAKAFKSLAYPYFESINFSTSSESSASEQGKGINSWATFVDLKYGNMNMSRGLDQSVLSHQNSAASFEIAKNIKHIGCKGIALASIKPPSSKIFTLNGEPHSTSSAKQIELTGAFSQSHSGVIRLTETLNFRCNVKSGMSGGERLSKFAQNAAGSRSTDAVTDRLPSGQRRGASKSPSETMEDTHKKAVFASSLIKNVISKKMQFEQERKMERGEISERHPTPSPYLARQESEGHGEKGSKELRRQSSKFSESSAEYAIVYVDELGDLLESGSCDTRSDSRRQDAAAPAPQTNLEPASRAGIAAKKGELEASKSTLLRSQNSAFRCWRDEELELQKDHKNDTTPVRLHSADGKEGEGEQKSAGSGKLTKMSHLFVPSIQLLSGDGEAGQQLQNRNDSPWDGGEIQSSNNTLYVAGSVVTSKSPEIKINLRSARDNKMDTFGVSKLRAPNIGCNAASLIRAEDLKCQALAAALKGESSDKVPHFMVRDIRDNKGKLQTPIHQVRDVRKLVKSSYHFVSLEKNKSDSHLEQKKQMSYGNYNSVSPVMIKCQSVNTNNGKHSVNLTELSKQEPFDANRLTSEGAKNAQPQSAAGRAPMGDTSDSSVGVIGLTIESRASSTKQETLLDITDKKPESTIPNQGALAKLQAAVKTMEQLYKFEKNEWKRKTEPHLLTDSHVLSLIAGEEHGGLEDDGRRASMTARTDSHQNHDNNSPPLGVSPGTVSLLRREDKDLSMFFQQPDSHRDRLDARSIEAVGKRNMSKPSTQTNFSNKSFLPKSPKLPVSLKVSRTKPSGKEGAKSKEVERSTQELFSVSADNENYLTIPAKTKISSNRQVSSAEKTKAVYNHTHPNTPSGHLGSGARGFDNTGSSIVMDTGLPENPPATIYHSLPLGMSTNQPQMYCFSPAITPAPTVDPFQVTQRKMLLDPTTGSYYLVDTPVQPATKRLFDPETGQYVDVPMPQPSMTPVPLPISPLALSPGAYGHTYMIYPGFMPTPSVIPARTLVQSQMSMQSEAEGEGKAVIQQADGRYMESPFYMATGKSTKQAGHGAHQPAATNRPLQAFPRQPVISFTSQQGPRIIAPPSFDGTTMSFVVEHRTEL
uniref:uncharacterized protein C4orf54 homolog isoform X1 n=2 Tax=Gasterosteus aculeatus aculeatus TaxID=481459 RepID=UPI001A98BFA6|nr:uncharacterized protein C4orf54 homolog isoform X1 [Gasterosteus aculeatus aculeatus]